MMISLLLIKGSFLLMLMVTLEEEALLVMIMMHMVNDISLHYLDDMVKLKAHLMTYMMTWTMKELEIT